MALTIGNTAAGVRILYTSHTEDTLNRPCHVILFPSSSSSSTTKPQAPTRSRTLHVASAAKKFSSRTGRFDGKNRKSKSAMTTTTAEEEEKENGDRLQIEEASFGKIENFVDDGFVMPDLPGEETDFWEGPQWDTFGFFVQYLWAFGIVFALIACGIAVATYNEGATDFKQTPAYKESVQSRDLLEEPDASNSDVFESNPTEVAPSLE
ncbi:hypothetical protein ACOSP7_025948 [Xanthoceras sorbifolium]